MINLLTHSKICFSVKQAPLACETAAKAASAYFQGETFSLARYQNHQRAPHRLKACRLATNHTSGEP